MLLSQKELSGKSFIFKLLPKSVFLTIFRLLRLLKVLLIFLPNDYLFFQKGFLSVKSTFKSLKRNPKQALEPFTTAFDVFSGQLVQSTILVSTSISRKPQMLVSFAGALLNACAFPT